MYKGQLLQTPLRSIENFAEGLTTPHLSWSLRQDMTRDIVIDALRMAWFKRHPSKQAGLILHSDR